MLLQSALHKLSNGGIGLRVVSGKGVFSKSPTLCASAAYRLQFNSLKNCMAYMNARKF
jgi:hypothetical protein